MLALFTFLRSHICNFFSKFSPLALANNTDGWFQMFAFVPQIAYIYDMNYTVENGETTVWYIFFWLLCWCFI